MPARELIDSSLEGGGSGMFESEEFECISSSPTLAMSKPRDFRRGGGSSKLPISLSTLRRFSGVMFQVDLTQM